MRNFKIKNITDALNKRDANKSRILDIACVEGFEKKITKLGAGKTMYLTTNSLDVSIHKMRVDKLITVIEVNKNEVYRKNRILQRELLEKQNKPQPTPESKKKVVEKKSSKKIEIKKETD